MIRQRMIIFTTLFLICVIGAWSKQYSPEAALAQNGPILWSLATDEEYQNASMIAFDVNAQSVVEEVVLPSELAVGVAYWSPDRSSIAAIVGEKRNALEFYGEQVCVFSSLGVELWCADYPSYVMIHNPGRSVVPPISWSPDSSQLYTVTRTTEANQLRQDELLYVDVIDVVDGSLKQRTPMGLGDIRIDDWIWSDNLTYAVLFAWNRETHETGLVVLPLNHTANQVNARDLLKVSNVGIGIATFDSKIAYVHVLDDGYELAIAEHTEGETNATANTECLHI